MAAPPKDSGLDPLRAGGAVLAVVLLLAVVALAAAAGGPATGGAGQDLAEPLTTLIFVVAAVWIAALLVASPILSGMSLTAGGAEAAPLAWKRPRRTRLLRDRHRRARDHQEDQSLQSAAVLALSRRAA